MEYEKLARELIRWQIGIPRHPPEEHPLETHRGEETVLAYLMEVMEETTPGRLSVYAGVSTARIANTLNSLEKKGLVTRRMDEHDRRKVIVRITKTGRQHCIEHQKKAVSDMSRLLEHLGESDAEEYVRLTKRVYEILTKIAEEDSKHVKNISKSCKTI